MSNYKLQVARPESIEFTLTITMPLSQWKELRALMKENTWPASEFSSRITDMIIQAQKTFYPEEPKP